MTLSLRGQDLDWREIADEIVALDAQGGEYLAVRGSGAILWRLLAGSTTRDALIQALVRTYGIDAARAGTDVNEFLAMLDERGLLTS